MQKFEQLSQKIDDAAAPELSVMLARVVGWPIPPSQFDAVVRFNTARDLLGKLVLGATPDIERQAKDFLSHLALVKQEDFERTVAI